MPRVFGLRSETGQASLVAIAAAALLLGPNVSRVGRAVGREDGPAARREAERAEGPLRVMVLNVLHGFPLFERLRERLDHIAAEIRRLDPDVVLLQEVPWTPRGGDGAASLAKATGLNHVAARDNGNRRLIRFDTSLAILSRYPLSDARVAELAPRAGVFEHRIGLRATVTTPRGPVRAVVTHLTNGDRAVNRGQTRSLASWVEAGGPGPTLVGGDFNATPDAPWMRDLDGRWIDAHRAANGDAPGFTCCVDDLSGSSGAGLDERVDYLFVVPDPTAPAPVLSSRRVLDAPFHVDGGWQWASDHAGLLVEVAW